MKKALTEDEKARIRMKTEAAEELGLLEKVRKSGWKNLTAKENGSIGGMVGKRRREARKQGRNGESACNRMPEKL